MIKTEEHLVQCFSDGVKHLVDNYNCKGLIHSLVAESTEWQTDEKFHDSHVCFNYTGTLVNNINNLYILGFSLLCSVLNSNGKSNAKLNAA